MSGRSFQRNEIRSGGTRVSRRSALRGAAGFGMGLAGAALLGCSSDKPTSTATGTAPAPGKQAAPVKGGVLRSPEVIANDGILEPSAHANRSLFALPTHSLLVRKNRDSYNASEWFLEPELATSWGQPDETTYVFKLRDAKFHNIAPVNGRPATSEDVRFSFERIGTDHPRFVRKGEFAGATFTTPDPRTFILKMPKPTPGTFSRITTAGTVCSPKRSPRPRGRSSRAVAPSQARGRSSIEIINLT